MGAEHAPPPPPLDPEVLAVGRQGLAETLARGLVEYSRQLVAADPRGAWQMLEDLAVAWRASAEYGQLERDADLLGGAAGPELYGVLEDSLALYALTPEMASTLAMDDDEFVARSVVVGRAAPLPGLDGFLDMLWSAHETQLRAPQGPRPADWPVIPEPADHPRVTRRDGRALLHELGDQLGSVQAAFELFIRDGGQDDPTARSAAVARIDAFARYNRRCELAQSRIAQTAWVELAIGRAELQSMSRTFVLGLSDDPERRALAMGDAEHRCRAFLFKERAEGASWAQAQATLDAFLRRSSSDA